MCIENEKKKRFFRSDVCVSYFFVFELAQMPGREFQTQLHINNGKYFQNAVWTLQNWFCNLKSNCEERKISFATLRITWNCFVCVNFQISYSVIYEKQKRIEIGCRLFLNFFVWTGQGCVFCYVILLVDSTKGRSWRWLTHLCLSVCLSVSRSLFHSLVLTLISFFLYSCGSYFLSHSLSLAASHSLILSLIHFLFLSLCFLFSLFFCLSLPLSHSLSTSFSFAISVFYFLSLSLSLQLSQSLIRFLSQFLCLLFSLSHPLSFLFLSLPICPSFSFDLYMFVRHCFETLLFSLIKKITLIQVTFRRIFSAALPRYNEKAMFPVTY